MTTYVTARISGRPIDEARDYGHGKVEATQDRVDALKGALHRRLPGIKRVIGRTGPVR